VDDQQVVALRLAHAVPPFVGRLFIGSSLPR
jgi:hypothetical protein